MTDSIVGQTSDLTSCDREPIHIPGAIVPHGALLVLDPQTLVVLQAAGDTATLLGVSVEALIGRSAHAIWQTRQTNSLMALATEPNLTQPRHFLDPLLRVFPNQPLDASLHRNEAGLIIELEAADTQDPFAADPLTAVQGMLAGLSDAVTLQAFCQVAADSVRRVLKYDRVMIYRFMPDDSGWVIAESREQHIVPLLDLHYPASDIPVQARALYVKNWLRLITEVDYTPAPLIPTLSPRTGKPLDMSQATLRDVSPVHRQYLRNMGVDASMSISIVRDGKLWGLFACHHYAPRRLPRNLRAVGELFGAMFSLQLESRQRAEDYEARLANRVLLQELMRDLEDETDYAAGLIRQAPLLLNYIQGGGISLHGDMQGGVAIRLSTEICSTGATPNETQIAALADWLAQHMSENDGIFITDRLGELWPPAAEYADVGSGLLAISVSRIPRDFIFWFRPEVIETVTWGGDPTKPVTVGPEGETLTPRTSFDAWRQEVRGRSSAWTSPDSDAAFDLRLSLLEVVLRRIEAAMREKARLYERDQLLMAELDHRVKNTLATIQALVVQTSRSADSLGDFVENLDGRIQSMAKAHSLLTQSHWDGVALKALISDELNAYGAGGADIVLGGPNVILSPKASLSLALAIHELATNAGKYGALSIPDGRISVHWTMSANGDLKLVWREAGGPRVTEPSRRGFGSQLIERALALDTAGSAKIDFDPAGVICNIELPGSTVIRVDAASAVVPSAKLNDNRQSKRPEDVRPRILVVEDSALVVMLLENVFGDLGWEMVGPATSVAEALPLARTENLTGALLDVNLNNEMSWEVASLLRERGVPFLFATGYDARTVLPPEFENEAVVGKPYRLQDLEHSLLTLLG